MWSIDRFEVSGPSSPNKSVFAIISFRMSRLTSFGRKREKEKEKREGGGLGARGKKTKTNIRATRLVLIHCDMI
jgi:hypothetical protein